MARNGTVWVLEDRTSPGCPRPGVAYHRGWCWILDVFGPLVPTTHNALYDDNYACGICRPPAAKARVLDDDIRMSL